MKKNLIKLLLVLIIFMFILFIYNYFKYKDKNGEYNLGKDKIISIEKIVGKRNLNNKRTSTNNYIIKEYEYTNVKDPNSDLSNYTDYLIEKCYFDVLKDYDLSFNTGKIHLAKQSIDDGYIILLDINYQEDKYTIKFTKGKGKIKILNNF